MLQKQSLPSGFLQAKRPPALLSTRHFAKVEIRFPERKTKVPVSEDTETTSTVLPLCFTAASRQTVLTGANKASIRHDGPASGAAYLFPFGAQLPKCISTGEAAALHPPAVL